MSFVLFGITGAEIAGMLVALTTQNVLSAIDVAATRWWERRKMASMPMPAGSMTYDPEEFDDCCSTEPVAAEIIEPQPPVQTIDLNEKVVLAAGTLNQTTGEVVPKFNGKFKGIDPASGLACVQLNMGGKIGTIEVLVDPTAVDKAQ